MKRTLSLVLVTMLSFTLQAQVYEWFDEAGNRHFSDKKPEGVAFRTLGEPGANLSSYRPTAIRQPPPVADSGVDGASSTENRRPAADVGARDPQAVCDEYLARIDRIHDRLRAGYDEPTGNRLRAARSALRAAYLRDCN
ncbi:MAG: hypothetical protein CMP07_04705 [Xanthomonadales bacterium]|nr:hypothetical protein [Xanthomonadales bacterium]|tara:strand:- start:296 stop:712 length:417 start_codon:yes stop_codon:yes gene_type:complete